MEIKTPFKINIWHNLLWILTFIVAYAASHLLVKELLSPSLPTGEELTAEVRQKTIIRTVNTLKSTYEFPFKLDDWTQWDDVVAEPSTVKYIYTILQDDLEQLSDDELKESMLAEVCAGKMRKVLDNGINFRYVYKDILGVQRYDILFTKIDCKNSM